MWKTLLQRVYYTSVYEDLLEAAKTGNTNQVKKLLDLGEDPNIVIQQHNGFAPLYFAVLYSHLDCALLLLENGANPNHHVKIGEAGTALHLAVQARSLSFIRLLLLFGAKRTETNKYKQPATHISISNEKMNAFMEHVCNQISNISKELELANQCLYKKEYHEAIEHYENAIFIDETQIKEEIDRTYDALYEGRQKPDNTSLINHLYERVLRHYDNIAMIYNILIKNASSECVKEKKKYLELLNKIVGICKKTNKPQEKYANTMAMLIMDEEKSATSLQETQKEATEEIHLAKQHFCTPGIPLYQENLPSSWSITYPSAPSAFFMENMEDAKKKEEETVPLLTKKNL